MQPFMNKWDGIATVFVIIIEGKTFAVPRLEQLQMRQKHNTRMEEVIINNNYVTYEPWSERSAPIEWCAGLHVLLFVTEVTAVSLFIIQQIISDWLELFLVSTAF